MNVIAVDDEQFALKELQTAIKEALPQSVCKCFDTPREALDFVADNAVDIAFLDIEMCGMNGIMLAKKIKEINGGTNIVFVTGYSQYAVDAFSIHASGYLMKPVTAKAVAETIEHLRHPPVTRSEKKLRVQTFGNFEVYAQGRPLAFARSKTKELFAYLISRQGALCSNNECADILWEDRTNSEAQKSLFRTLVADLLQQLKKSGIDDAIIKRRGYLAVVPDKIACDLYDFCAGIDVNNYRGEFMRQYKWAEFTNSHLERERSCGGR